MYRPEIRILDCTIRDGGLMNDHRFSDEMVRDVFEAVAASGVDYIELGYKCDKAQYPVADFGPWKFCDEDALRRVARECDTKISIMADVGRTDMSSILPKKDSIVSMYRVATYAKEVDKAIVMAQQFKDLGYEVCINMMAVSHILEPDLEEALEQLSHIQLEAVYLVDSFGYLYSEQVHYFAEKYRKALPNTEIGIHCHNNQQLAFANTVEGIIKGINFLDGSIFGMGRAAGNCTTELLLGFLKNPKYDIRPVLDCIQQYFIPLQKELQWGYQMPYLIAGILNRHPKSAMAFMRGDNSLKFSEYYNQVIEEEV